MFRFSLRQKILLSFVAIFLLFMGVMFPFASHSVKRIVTRSICERASELILKIKNAPDDNALVQRLKDQKYLIFFRVSIITNERKLLYDSYTMRLLGPGFNKKLALNHPEVEQAFREGIGFHEGESKLLRQRFVYMAKSFDFHGKPYVLRIAFPYKFVAEMTRDFEISALGLCATVLLLFSFMSWMVISRLTRPIQQIITTIKPYQEGRVMTLPEIKLANVGPYDEAGKLADTLNSLSAKIQGHIDSLTKERNEKEAILESLVEGVVAVDDHLEVTYANQTALKLLSMEREALVGKHFSVANQPACLDLLSVCMQERKVLTETLRISREGENIYYLDIIVAPKMQDSGAILIMEDKTAHYKLIEMRKEFIANASHELKTPITIIRGFAETLHDNPQLPQETFQGITNKIVHSCTRMATLIKNLLTLSDIEHIPHVRLLECDLFELVESCTAMLQDLYPDALIVVHKLSEEDLIINGDPSLLEMALMNLLENAAKYSTPPAHITVTLAKEDGWIKISIADKGIGIAASDLEHIFERFYTVNKAHSRKLGGSGLGLSIVKTIVDKHFGKISVASHLGEGTTFTIHLKA